MVGTKPVAVDQGTPTRSTDLELTEREGSTEAITYRVAYSVAMEVEWADLIEVKTLATSVLEDGVQVMGALEMAAMVAEIKGATRIMVPSVDHDLLEVEAMALAMTIMTLMA